MALIDAVLAELQHDAQTSRRLLERVPEYQFGWRSTPEARTLGQHALQVATLPRAIAELVATPTPARVSAEPESGAALVSALDESVAVAARLLGRMDDAALLDAWRLMHGEREVFSLPRGALLRSLMLDHWRHERGRLAIQLRALGVTVPSREGAVAEANLFAVP
jgi:hypothetical protein